ncbi:MAG TPA: GNAT family N-acetyltransferase [Oculatellaceae cyanobacterium]
MQLRIGNKQDEPACRDLAKKCAGDGGFNFDLETADADLRNIELAFIGHDGVFIVVEENEAVIAFAAARKGENEDVCSLRYLCVHESARRRGLGRKLVEQILFFARNLEYKVLRTDFRTPDKSNTRPDAAEFFSRVGFHPSGAGKYEMVAAVS